MPLRVVSYNIHKGMAALGRREILHDLRRALQPLQADLLLLQEVQGRNARNPGLHAQHEHLGEALGFEVVYGRNAVQRHTDHGNAVLSRWPVLAWSNRDVSHHRFEQRGLLHTVIEVPGLWRLHSVAVHLGLFSVSRRWQTDRLCELVEGEVGPDEPLLIAGDFNDWQHELSHRLMDRLGVHEVFARAPAGADVSAWASIPKPAAGPRHATPPRTFPAVLPWLRLDRLYVRRMDVQRAWVPTEAHWSGLSDHLPIVADLHWS